MLHLDLYPLACRQVLAAFGSAAPRWAASSGLTLDDVLQELALAALAGADPARAVPAALGIRRLPGGRWVALDPLAHPFSDADEMGETLAAEGEAGAEVGEEQGIGGTADIAARLRVTRRRAQQLAAAQRSRVAACGDLFAGGV
jgi:hypothetical protein